MSAGLGMMVLVDNKRYGVKYLNVLQSLEPYRLEEAKVTVSAAPKIISLAGIVVRNKLVFSAGYLLPATIHNVFRARYSALQLASAV